MAILVVVRIVEERVIMGFIRIRENKIINGIYWNTKVLVLVGLWGFLELFY